MGRPVVLATDVLIVKYGYSNAFGIAQDPGQPGCGAHCKGPGCRSGRKRLLRCGYPRPITIEASQSLAALPNTYAWVSTARCVSPSWDKSASMESEALAPCAAAPTWFPADTWKLDIERI